MALRTSISRALGLIFLCISCSSVAIAESGLPEGSDVWGLTGEVSAVTADGAILLASELNGQPITVRIRPFALQLQPEVIASFVQGRLLSCSIVYRTNDYVSAECSPRVVMDQAACEAVGGVQCSGYMIPLAVLPGNFGIGVRGCSDVERADLETAELTPSYELPREYLCDQFED